MFSPEKPRYMTRGINKEVLPELQVAMWQSIDTMRQAWGTLDYLQVFKFENLSNEVLAVRHEQEEPEKVIVFYVPFKEEYRKILTETVFVIDDIDHCTMLFAKEY
ncbi:MAG: DUF960 domain-containing protein [Clostridiales bacterium]|nr:DUF960 domain-containing protein [Clostridiales bacterium]